MNSKLRVLNRESRLLRNSPNALFVISGEPQVGKLIVEVSSLLAKFETLLVELETTGVLASEAIDRVRLSADTFGAEHRRIFSRFLIYQNGDEESFRRPFKL